MTKLRVAGVVTFLVLLTLSRRALAQTAFSYSGVLYATNASQYGTGPAIGTFDFRCSLWPSPTEADPLNRVGPTNSFSVTLNAGAFATSLDFGPLTGGPYFLQTDVRRSGSVTFKTLVPRKQILPVPLAQHANTASNLLGTVPSTSLTGTIADARLSPNVPLLNSSPSFSGTVTASGFVGDGSGLSNLNGGAVQPGSIANASLADNTVTAGKVAGGQVVKSINGLSDAVTLSAGPNVTLTPSGNNLQISASGGAGGLTWQVVSGTTQQAQPNTGYLLTNDTQVTLTLPASLNVGDVVRVSGSGAGGWKIAQNAGQSMVIKNSSSAWTPRENNRYWQAIASSADGSKLAAIVSGGQIYTSTDSGIAWTPRHSSSNWYSVASSADGTKLVACETDGQLYTSTDSGETWTARESIRSWNRVASSADGSKLVAVEGGGQIYTSTDSGVTWTPRETNRDWWSVASSADGTKLVAGIDTGQIYTSTDSGVTWAPHASVLDWISIASSADGTHLAACDYSSLAGRIWVSSNSGVTWRAHGPYRQWLSVASSADGSKLVAAAYDSVVGIGGTANGEIFVSSDFGSSWTPQDSYRNWSCVASSADGNKLVAGDDGGRLYLSAAGSTFGTIGYLIGEQNAAVELQYTGNGQFILLSHEGTIIPY